jgi:hypothetical protein
MRRWTSMPWSRTFFVLIPIGWAFGLGVHAVFSGRREGNQTARRRNDSQAGGESSPAGRVRVTGLRYGAGVVVTVASGAPDLTMPVMALTED